MGHWKMLTYKPQGQLAAQGAAGALCPAVNSMKNLTAADLETMERCNPQLKHGVPF